MINLPSSTCCAELQRLVDNSFSEMYIFISIPDDVFGISLVSVIHWD